MGSQVALPGEGAAAPTLGVVIPTLDEEACLGPLLERLSSEDEVAGLRDGADRVVVADGGSADRTREIALACGAALAVAPRGRGSQLAAGAALLETNVLFFLHADCRPAPGALARLRAAFAAGAAAAALSQAIDAPGVFFRLVESSADLRVRLFGLVYGDSGLAVRRDLYREVGGFRPIPLFEDVDLSLRLRRRARPRLVAGARLVVSARRWREEGALRATARNWMLALLWAAGADPARLSRHYAPAGRRAPSP